MTFQPAPDCAEIVLNFICGGKPLANVMNVWFPSGYLQADLDNLSAFVDGQVVSDYLPYINTAVTYLNTTVRGLSSTIDLISIDASGSAAGGNAGSVMPNNVTLCFRLQTGFTGRSARGRFYAMPTVQGHLTTANSFTTTYRDFILGFLNNVLGGVLAIGCHLVILSRYSGGVARVTAVHNDVLSIDARNTTVDSQRGRLPSGH